MIDTKGRKPDPLRLSAINNMSASTNGSDLQAFLGLANYYGNLIPKVHILRAPLNKLLKKDLKWNWKNECQSAFEEIKKYQSQT